MGGVYDRLILDTVREAALPLGGGGADSGPLMRLVGDAHFCLLGEASHGTHEFYRERAEITKRLIAERGVTAVAAEADWPDAYRANLFVRGESDDTDAEEALQSFRRFPSWMWRNTDVVEFIDWLREWNDALPPGAPKVGFYGLDLYSLGGFNWWSQRLVLEVVRDGWGRAAEGGWWGG